MMRRLMFKKKPQPRYAFFDVDDTLISNKSMFSFMDLYFEIFPDKTLQTRFNEEMGLLIKNNTSWEIANKIYYSYFVNFTVKNVELVSQAWFTQYANNKEQFYQQNVIAKLREHQADNVSCVFVSGSFVELLTPIAQDLDIEHILAINVAKYAGVYTGEIIPPQTIGLGKAQAIRDFIRTHNANKYDCFAYGDDISDVPMLESVGNPVAISGGRNLVDHALKVGWPVIQPN